MRNIFKTWLPLAIVTTGLAGLVYGAVQQDYRQNANDPQIQMAEDIATLLNNGAAPASLTLPAPIDLSESLAPFVVIYDEQGKAIVGSAMLHNVIPTPPLGVLAYAETHDPSVILKTGENRLTWQPEPNVREAIVVTHFQNSAQTGFVLVGRSLREVEARESRLTLMVSLAWLTTLIISLLACVFVAYL